MVSYSITTYERGSQARVGMVLNGRVVDLLDRWDEMIGSPPFSDPYPIKELLAGLDEFHPRLEELAVEPATLDSPTVDPATVRAPILYPSTIFCAAANYRAHAKEMGGQAVDKSVTKPYFFLKLSDQCVIGPGQTIRLPKGANKVDWEGELAVVVGRGGVDIPVERALDHVAGYTIMNDVSDRERNFRSDWRFKYDWFGGKSAPTFAPLGPHIVPRFYIEAPNDLDLKLWVNDELMQNANTCDMIFDVQEQIAYLSSRIPLTPGDVVATGTPEGVGMAQGIFLKPGDRVTIEIEGIGRLVNSVDS